MSDDRDICERLEDKSIDGAIFLRINAAMEIRALRLYVARLECKLAKVEVRYEKLGDHSSKQALDIVTLGHEVGRLREALQPFADYASQDGFDLDSNGNPLADDDGVGWVYLKIAHFRAARAAFAGQEPKA